MEIQNSDIAHLADLSNFSLTPAETESLRQDLQGIIQYISQLDELDTANISPTYQVFEMTNIWRTDEIKAQDASRDELLKLSRDTKEYQIKVPKVL